MIQTKKICVNCKKGHLEKKCLPQYLNIENAPEFKVESFLVDVCTNCATETMSQSDSNQLNKLFLEQLTHHYSSEEYGLIPKKVARWMKKVRSTMNNDSF